MNQLNLLARLPARLLDGINDKLTSYRLMLYFLLSLVGWAVIGSFFKQVPYSWHEILISTAWLLAVCWLTNKLVSRFLNIPANKESDLITALILSLILAPPVDFRGFAVLAGAGITAIVSKYVISLYKSHVFNPAAAGAYIAGELFHRYPAWWVGTKFMIPLVVIGGLLILRKMKRFSLVLAFLAVFLLYLIYGTSGGGDVHFLWRELISTQVLFFAIVMLTEPLTSPTLASRFLPYAAIVGVGYSVTKLKISPELSLLIGNLFTFIVARNRRYEVKFIKKIKEAEGIFSYLFSMPPRFRFTPGQYMEWTIAQHKTDARGNRRYLTLSSSPTEPGLMFTVKHPNPASAFKLRLDELKPGDSILASHLSGSFCLPKDPSKKVALIAGGVGITPFRSMIKHLLIANQKRDVLLLYSAKSDSELAFKQLFTKASTVGLKTAYITGERLDRAKIKTAVPDFVTRHFYVSGPLLFVNAAQTALLELGVSGSNITTDYFPGYGG